MAVAIPPLFLGANMPSEMTTVIRDFALRHSITDTEKVGLMLIDEMSPAELDHYTARKNAERITVGTWEYIFWENVD
jgi:hypothetical protein